MKERDEIKADMVSLGRSPVACFGSLTSVATSDDPPEREAFFGEPGFRLICDRYGQPCPDDDEQVLGRWLGICPQPANPEFAVSGLWVGANGIEGGVVAAGTSKVLLTDKFLRCSMVSNNFRYREDGEWRVVANRIYLCMIPLADVTVVTGCRSGAAFETAVESVETSRIFPADGQRKTDVNAKHAISEFAVSLALAIRDRQLLSEQDDVRARVPQMTEHDLRDAFMKRLPQQIVFPTAEDIEKGKSIGPSQAADASKEVAEAQHGLSPHAANDTAADAVCRRIGCPQRGILTSAARCPDCDHPTIPASSFRP